MTTIVQGVDPRISQRFQAEVGFPLEPHLVVLALMGSHSHGTYLPPEDPNAVDDVDLMGFVVPPLEYHLGLPRWDNWRLQVDELDVVLYNLDKAVRLLLKSNPNIVGLLWLRNEEYVYRTPVFDRLQAARDLFSTQVAAEAFAGYAFGQLKRMEAFDLERMAEYERLSGMITQHGPLREVLEADPKKMQFQARTWGLAFEDLIRFRKIHREHFSGYMGEKRKAMVRRYQYDVKNAAHLIRLLRMGKEYLETGRLNVYRTDDAEELMAIKRGAWTLEQVKAKAERLFVAVEAARERSILPLQPDAAAASRLLVELHADVLDLSVNRLAT